MRRLMIVASMLAMVLLVAAPAFGQSGEGVQQASNGVGDISVAGGDNVAASQYQYGDTTQENNTEVNVAQVNQQAASGGGASQQASNEVGDIDVAGGDNVAASQYQYGDTAQQNNTEVNVAQTNQQAASGGGAEQQASNEVGDISVAGGDNVAASQYQYGDTTQESNTEVNVDQGNQQVSGGSGSDVDSAQFNFFGLSSLFG